jgi:hypothetical protein
MRVLPLLALLAGCILADPGGAGPIDADGDGFPATEDCDDLDPDARPDTSWIVDADDDGFGGTTVVQCEPPSRLADALDDCDDSSPAIAPGRPEFCDGIDQDCDGEVDEDALDRVTSYADADGDGFGDPATAERSCEVGAARTLDGTDCDDTDGDVFPGADERCDGGDDDCDGAVDDDPIDAITVFEDDDRDGWGDPMAAVEACAATDGWATASGDCDDTNDAIHPEAAEPGCPDPTDYDCDGVVACSP